MDESLNKPVPRRNRLHLFGKIVAGLAVLTVVITLAIIWGGDAVRSLQEDRDLHDPHLIGSLRHIQFHSTVLGVDKDFLIYLPPGYNDAANRERHYPTIYLLHGCPGQARDWVVKGEAHLTVERLILQHRIEPVIMVFPDLQGPRGVFDCTAALNRTDGKWNAEDYMVKEIVGRVDSKYRTMRDSAHRGIAGLSMGGFTALNLGVRHPDVFSVMGAISGYFRMTDFPPIARAMEPNRPDLWAANSPADDIVKLPQRSRLHIYLDVGDDDVYLRQNKQFAAELKKLGVDHALKMSPGAHTYKFWQQQLQDTVLFMDKRFHD